MEERRLTSITPTPTAGVSGPPVVGAGLQYQKKRWVSVVFNPEDGAPAAMMTTTSASPATTTTTTTLPKRDKSSTQTKSTNRPSAKRGRKKKSVQAQGKLCAVRVNARNAESKVEGIEKIEEIKRPTALGKRKASATLAIQPIGKQRRSEKATDFHSDEEREEEIARQHKPLQFWTADSHLHTYTRARRCVQLFDQTSLTLVHPAVLADTSLQWYFFESDCSKDSCLSDISPLAFNITLAICLGAWAAGDRQLEEEYWMKARQQAGSVFDVCDYHVADGLMRMFGYLGLKGRIDQASYYATPALVTLEKLNCSNSTIYSWLIIFRYLENKEMITFRQKAAHALSMPDLTKTRASTKLICHTREGEDEEKWDQYSLDLSLEAVFSDIILKMGLICSQATTNPDNYPLLQQLEQRVAELKKTWLPIRHVFRHPHQVKMNAVFAVNLVTIYRALGKMDAAVQSALDLLALAEDPVFRYQPLLQPTVYYPLQVLLETGNMEALRRLVAQLAPRRGGHFLDLPALEPFKAFYPPFNRITETIE